MISKVIASACFGGAWTLFAVTEDPLAQLGVTVILAASIYWMVQRIVGIAKESVEASMRSAKAVEKLTAKLEKRPCLIQKNEE